MKLPQVGEVWIRLPPESPSRWFPQRSWKVEIIRADTLNVIHKVVEYDGEARTGTTHSSLETEDFLVMYEKVK